MNQTKSKTSLFLIEMLIAILFFALVAVVGVRLFALSSVTARESEELNFATSLCSNAAEVFEAKEGDVNAIADYFGVAPNENYIRIYFDEDWQICENAKDSTFSIRIIVGNNNKLATAEITALRSGNGKEIFTIKDSKYCPQKISEKGDSNK